MFDQKNVVLVLEKAFFGGLFWFYFSMAAFDKITSSFCIPYCRKTLLNSYRVAIQVSIGMAKLLHGSSCHKLKKCMKKNSTNFRCILKHNQMKHFQNFRTKLCMTFDKKSLLISKKNQYVFLKRI